MARRWFTKTLSGEGSTTKPAREEVPGPFVATYVAVSTFRTGAWLKEGAFALDESRRWNGTLFVPRGNAIVFTCDGKWEGTVSGFHVDEEPEGAESAGR